MNRSLFLLIMLGLILACSSTKNTRHSTFSSEQIALITNADSLTPMRVYKITNKTDSLLLRTKCTDVLVNPKDPVIRKFMSRLYATVRDSMSLGVGIAAPQVGILKNIILVQRFDKKSFPFEVYFNPKITSYSIQKQTFSEGCLSIPDRTDTVNTRAFRIILNYDTLYAEHKTDTVEGFTSVIFQHEIDHLNGILYLDHLEKEIKDAKD